MVLKSLYILNHYSRRWIYSVNLTLCSGDCTGLPRNSKLKTTQNFPVPQGSIVTVECPATYKLVGNSAMTCQYDTQYSTIDGEMPHCKRKSKLYLFYFITPFLLNL